MNSAGIGLKPDTSFFRFTGEVSGFLFLEDLGEGWWSMKDG
jgi:hypothetical protein